MSCPRTQRCIRRERDLNSQLLDNPLYLLNHSLLLIPACIFEPHKVRHCPAPGLTYSPQHWHRLYATFQGYASPDNKWPTRGTQGAISLLFIVVLWRSFADPWHCSSFSALHEKTRYWFCWVFVKKKSTRIDQKREKISGLKQKKTHLIWGVFCCILFRVFIVYFIHNKVAESQKFDRFLYWYCIVVLRQRCLHCFVFFFFRVSVNYVIALV